MTHRVFKVLLVMQTPALRRTLGLKLSPITGLLEGKGCSTRSHQWHAQIRQALEERPS